MSHQSTVPKKMDNSYDDQNRERRMVDMLLEKVVKLEKGLKDLQLQDCASCHKKCEKADQEKKVSESLVKNLNLELEEMNRRQGELQQDLLLLVESCLEFEKDLIESKKKNEQLSKQVKSLLTEKKEKVKEARTITISSSESPQPTFQPSVSAPVFHPAASFSQNFYLSGPEFWPEHLNYDVFYWFQGWPAFQEMLQP